MEIDAHAALKSKGKLGQRHWFRYWESTSIPRAETLAIQHEVPLEAKSAWFAIDMLAAKTENPSTKNLQIMRFELSMALHQAMRF